MSDLISRQTAIDAVKAYLTDCQIEDADWHGNGIEHELESLPSAQPERKTGKWLSEYGSEPVTMQAGCPERSCYCSECGEWLVASDEYYVKGNYCPNCGARMDAE